jgi:S-adenosylmethionine:tRNA ribosyltransferase-isomerase
MLNWRVSIIGFYNKQLIGGCCFGKPSQFTHFCAAFSEYMIDPSAIPIAISDYHYDLPEERIAKYPLPDRAASRLLCWEEGEIRHLVFGDLPRLLSGRELLFFNNTRVIPARLFFRKESGALIEVFLLSPQDPPVVDLAMHAGPGVLWYCTIGNLKRWPEGSTLRRHVKLSTGEQELRATLVDRSGQLVRLDWDDAVIPFARMVEASGESPIPPYLHRAADEADKQRYQTVYGKREGAVAAPTAGLHFTPEIIQVLQDQGVLVEELTLHVSAGTFRPVKAENAVEHDMHAEQVVLQRRNLEALLQQRPVVAVGTTSLRTLESLYWYGVKLLDDPGAMFRIEKLYPYQRDNHGGVLPSLAQAVGAILEKMDREQRDEIWGSTEIYIFPGYRFRVVDRLLTNFHQPSSTLLLLVAAFVGGDDWKTMYREALDKGYRFLSYGDASLLTRRD